MPESKTNDTYSEQEAQHRFKKALWAALNTPPKPLKSMTPKGVPAQRKKPPKKTNRDR